jgi:NAD(P)-dependent dehydrogenase (short-subunit alcohol dehydrogenase family)
MPQKAHDARRRKATPAADETTRQHRDIQRQIDEADEEAPETSAQEPTDEQPSQLGARPQPEPPMAEQHLDKPGLESELDPRPQYLAPYYRGSGKLEDKVALITGGDSGIGRAVAVLFAREGADVAIVYLPVEQPDAEETCAAVEHEGRRCLMIAGDVTDLAFCQVAVAQTVEELGQLDVLVNNAAFQEHAKTLDDLTPEHFDLTMRTNLYGYFYMVKAALPHLKSGSAIVNSGSVTGIDGSKELVDYATTKGGIHAFTKSLAKMLLERGIRVNAVAPGPVWTPLNPADKAAEDVADFGADVAMKRPAQPEELSPAYVFLASPVCSSYITGEVLPVLGGQT